MPKGKIVKNKKKQANFPEVDDIKIRSTLIMMADKYNEQARDIIKHAYSNQKLLAKWQKMRNSGDFQQVKGKAHRRKIIEFPNAYVFDFVDTVMSVMYGEDWLYDDRALKHELVRPWLVVKL